MSELSDIKKDILEEEYRSRLTVHPGGMKIYKDLKRTLWWEGMKKEVSKFISKCMTCQHIKAEHQKPSGLLQPFPFPQWKWEYITIDFVVGLAQS